MRSIGERAAAWLLARSARAARPGRAEWVEAMRAEVPEVRGGAARLRWALGAVRVAGCRRLDLLFWPAALLACAGLLWLDRSPSDVANQATLLLLLVCAGGLGLAWPRRAWIAGLACGGCLSAAHVAYVALGARLPYAMSPAGMAGALSLLVLLAPALLAALGAARLRRALT